MKRQPPGTRNRRDAQQSLPNNTFRDNDDIKVHETSLSTMYRRFGQILISKDVIKAMAIALTIVFAFLAGANSVSCTHIERGKPSQFPESTPKDAFPRYIRHLINETEQGMDVRRLDLNMDLYPSKRTIYASKEALQQQEHLHDSKDYKYSRPDVFETAECKAQYPWQLMQFPTCNTVFENDLTAIYTEKHKRMRPSLIAHGYWRDVWLVKDFNTSKRVMKTLRYEHAFEGRNYDRHLRDALTMERMTKSSHVVDIYGFCGNSGLFEYGRGGDIMDRLWPEQKENNLTMLDKLEIATQVAMAVADLHNFDKEGQASVAHTDITPSQFISINGVFKLNDFNRVRFLRWSMELNEPCGYYVGKNPGKLRSPEEYSYDEQSEKVSFRAMVRDQRLLQNDLT